ncbi:hypothetical protein B0H11DRAFT_707002 [Mycena galericulata]|nr:hypothetical protein B0H11DRAFT_707002 [Mycena galericulata]
MFQNLSAIDEQSRNKLPDYPAALHVKTDDPMEWWWAHRRQYPVLHQLTILVCHPLLLLSSVYSRSGTVCCTSPVIACALSLSAAYFVWYLGDAATYFGSTT